MSRLPFFFVLADCRQRLPANDDGGVMRRVIGNASKDANELLVQRPHPPIDTWDVGVANRHAS